MIPPRSIAANVLCCPRGGDITCIHVLPRFNCELVCRYLEANGRLNVSFNFSFLRGEMTLLSRYLLLFNLLLHVVKPVRVSAFGCSPSFTAESLRCALVEFKP